jgi:octaprenyl-diphosphate synthase
MLKPLVEPMQHPLTDLYAPIAAEMTQVESLLKTELTSKYEFVDELLRKSNRLSGKRLRPALLLLFAKSFGDITEDQIKLAAAIEMIHTATLVHDDILDSAEQRRHNSTINYEYGNQTAILTGDFLFSHAFFLTSTLPTTFAAQEIGRSTNKVCEGEMRQIGTKDQFDLSQKEYLEIIDAKTAVLCSCATKLGTHYAGGTDAEVDAAAAYGTNLGIAFQIVDDLLDIVGDESKTGKSLGTDLEQRKPTLPLIHLLDSVADSEKSLYLNSLRSDDLNPATILDWFSKSDSVNFSKTMAIHYAKKAVDALGQLQASPEKEILAAIPHFVLERSH